MVTVAITQNLAIEQAITEALHHLELEPLICGPRVAQKPNDTWASAGDTTAVTKPDTLHAVLRYVQQFGPRGGDRQLADIGIVPERKRPNSCLWHAESFAPIRSLMRVPAALHWVTSGGRTGGDDTRISMTCHL
jgi:hypothetical protein